MYGVEHRRYALNRDRGPSDRLHEPADGARREAHEHRSVVGEQEQAVSKLLTVLDDHIRCAVQSSHSAVVHDETHFDAVTNLIHQWCKYLFTEKQTDSGLQNQCCVFTDGFLLKKKNNPVVPLWLQRQ